LPLVTARPPYCCRALGPGSCLASCTLCANGRFMN
jgi:hypothetical protein